MYRAAIHAAATWHNKKPAARNQPVLLAMFICVDTYYSPEKTYVAGVVFRDIASDTTENEYIRVIGQAEKYKPGYFFRRELPGILMLLKGVDEPLHTIIIDGHVWLSPDRTPGLGAHLFTALQEKKIVIGVAKNPFRNVLQAEQVYRGLSTKPLYITAVGIEAVHAALLIKNMHGQYRIPTLLKYVDGLSRRAASS